MPAQSNANSAVDDELFDGARRGDVDKLSNLLDKDPDKLYARTTPYNQTMLHLAAANGHLNAVDFLLKRGIDPNTRESGDNTYAMHWAAAAGHIDIVRRLADAGGDVVGQGDDHALDVIGWATGWDGCDDARHRAVADFLISRGARHHIYSAISLSLEDEVRRILARDPSALRRPQSHNEDFRLPLHFAVQKNLPRMVELLLELGADPLAVDASGFTAVAYATMPDIDRPVMEAIRNRVGPSLLTSVALGDWDTAARLLREGRGAIEPDGPNSGALHLMAKRGNAAAVKWLLDHGADPNARWHHWDAEVTPLHLAVMQAHADVVRVLLVAGADPTIRDSKHDSDPVGWARFFGRAEIVEIFSAHDTT